MKWLRRGRPEAGVTLIEMLIVLSLMGILAAALMPSATPSVRERLDSAAHLVAADIEYCRSLAITNNSNYRLSFRLAEDAYTLEHVGTNSTLDVLPLTPTHTSDDPPKQQVVRLDDLPVTGLPVELVTVQVRSNPVLFADRVEFGPLGETLAADATWVWLACGQGAERLYQVIKINPVTGLTWIEPAQARPPAQAGM